MRRFSIRMILLQNLIVVLFCGFQTTVWPALFGHIQSPQLWLPWVIFLALYRPYFEALFVAYFFGLTMLAFTSLSLHLVWPTFLVLVSTTAFAKNKVFWPGLRYFMIASALSCLLWNLTIFILSWLLESPSAPPLIVERILESLLTTLASPIVYGTLMWCEKFRPTEYSKTTAPAEAEL